MSGRTILLIVAALIAAFTAISIKSHFTQAPVETAAPVAQDRVLVAKRDLTPGSFVQAQDLDWAAAPTAPEAEPLLHEGTVRMTDFYGAIVRRPLHAGDPVPQASLMKSGEGGFMSAVIEPGMRAISIAVNATSGNAGFISPGDRVDLIVTHRVKNRSASAGPQDDSVVSETFVRDVRVIAVDQMLDNPDNKAILAKTVTVEVKPRQAEQISVAEEMGKISMVLRSASQEGSKPVKAGDVRVLGDMYGAHPTDDSFTRDSDVSTLLEHKDTMVPRVRVIRGDQSENLDFYQDLK